MMPRDIRQIYTQAFVYYKYKNYKDKIFWRPINGDMWQSLIHITNFDLILIKYMVIKNLPELNDKDDIYDYH